MAADDKSAPGITAISAAPATPATFRTNHDESSARHVSRETPVNR